MEDLKRDVLLAIPAANHNATGEPSTGPELDDRRPRVSCAKGFKKALAHQPISSTFIDRAILAVVDSGEA